MLSSLGKKALLYGCSLKGVAGEESLLSAAALFFVLLDTPGSAASFLNHSPAHLACSSAITTHLLALLTFTVVAAKGRLQGVEATAKFASMEDLALHKFKNLMIFTPLEVSFPNWNISDTSAFP